VDRPFTVEHLTATAREARDRGYEEVALVFEGIASKLALFNEASAFTVEEARERLGEEEFWTLLGFCEARAKGSTT